MTQLIRDKLLETGYSETVRFARESLGGITTEVVEDILRGKARLVNVEGSTDLGIEPDDQPEVERQLCVQLRTSERITVYPPTPPGWCPRNGARNARHPNGKCLHPVVQRDADSY